MKWRISRPQHWYEAWFKSIPTWLVVTVAVLGLSLLKVSVEVPSLIPLSDRPANRVYQQVVRVLLQDVESIAAVIAVIIYVKSFPERRAQKHYNAWCIIDLSAAAHMSVSYARYEAMQELHKDGLSLQGIEAPGANLAEIELSNAELCNCNLQGANLEKANLCGADLSGSNLQGANLARANLVKANLVGSNLTGANLRGAELWDAKLWDADLTDAELRWAELHDYNLKGAKLCNTVMPDGSKSPPLEEMTP